MLYIYAKVAMRRPNPTAYGHMVHVLSFKWLIYIQNGGHIYIHMFCIYIMYLCIFNIQRAKNFGGNLHVNEQHKLISLLVLTQDLIFRLRKLLSSVDLYYIWSLCEGLILQHMDKWCMCFRLNGYIHSKWRTYIYIYMFCIYIMYLCIFNIQRAKNFGGNLHVNEQHKLISLLVLTQDLIFRLRKLLSSVDLYYMVAMRRTNPTAYGQMVHVLLFKWLIYHSKWRTYIYMFCSQNFLDPVYIYI